MQGLSHWGEADGLFSAGIGNTFNKLTLEDYIKNHHGKHGQKAARHQDGEVGGELTPQSGKTGGQGHHL